MFYHEILCFEEILETLKPYLMNTYRIDLLPTLLLLCSSIDSNHDLTQLLLDKWILVKFKTQNETAKVYFIYI